MAYLLFEKRVNQVIVALYYVVDTFPLELRALPHPNFSVAPHTSWVNGPAENFITFFNISIYKSTQHRSYLHSYGGQALACDRDSQGGCGTSRLQHTLNHQVHHEGNGEI